MLFAKSEEERACCQFLRVLQEFPWLWAVKNTWNPHYSRLYVCRATVRLLLSRPTEPCQVWVKTRSARDGKFRTQRVNQTTQRTGQTLADAICEAIVFGDLIEYVVFTFLNGPDGLPKDLMILRAPVAESRYRQQDLHCLCVKLASPPRFKPSTRDN